MSTLIIDPELQALIPPLTEDEFKGLEADIIRDGVRNPIIVWAGHNVIVDGHNRYHICQEHNIPFAIFEKEFEDKAEVIDFMYEEQTHRRNLTPGQKSALEIDVSEAKEREAAKRRADENRRANLKQNRDSSRGDQLVTSGRSALPEDRMPAQMDEQSQKYERAVKFTTPEPEPDITSKPETMRTAERLAERAGVGIGTMKRTMAVKHSGETDLYDKVRSGEMSANKAYTEMKERQKPKPIPITDPENGEIHLYPNAYANEVISCGILMTEAPEDTGWLYSALSGVRHDGFAYVFIDPKPEILSEYLAAQVPMNVELSQVLVWSFDYMLGNNDWNHYKPSWKAILFYRGVDAGKLNFPRIDERSSVHAVKAENGETGKAGYNLRMPIELAKRLIKQTGKESDVLFDPFAHEGTFLIAAQQLGHDAIGYESDESKLDIARKRGVVTE